MSSNPYKTREGGATVTIFVPYDCQNNCPFCVNKQEYANCAGFSVDKIIDMFTRTSNNREFVQMVQKTRFY